MSEAVHQGITEGMALAEAQTSDVDAIQAWELNMREVLQRDYSARAAVFGEDEIPTPHHEQEEPKNLIGMNAEEVEEHFRALENGNTRQSTDPLIARRYLHAKLHRLAVLLGSNYNASAAPVPASQINHESYCPARLTDITTIEEETQEGTVEVWHCLVCDKTTQSTPISQNKE